MSELTKKGRITIDREKCTGCGHCVEACHAGALAMVDGKACLVDENHCDGLGVCIGECPFGAISFGEEAKNSTTPSPVPPVAEEKQEETLACGCPGHMNQVFAVEQLKPVPKPVHHSQATPCSCQDDSNGLPPIRSKSELGAWPIQLHLIRPSSPQFQGADLLIAASCSAFSHAAFHEEMLRGKGLVIACPKLDRQDGYHDKLTALFR
ncbi:MAG: 4Fe-4S binding protein, partial [Planctomycetia bacterium]